MKIFIALASGIRRSLKTWKGILIMWLVLLALASLVALPLKGIINTELGSSTITEKFANGFDIETMTDMGTAWEAIINGFSSGLLVLISFVIIVNAFVTGGLFDSMKDEELKFSSRRFFESSAKNFFPFLLITFIVGIILLSLFMVLIVLPVRGIFSPGSIDEKVHWLIFRICAVLFIFLSMFFLLVADYARAWQVKQEKMAGFRALGFGFSQSFKKFLSSWPMMILIFLVQALYLFIVFKVIGPLKPSTGIGVIGLFILSQLLFLVRILLKTIRYGSVTSLMEINNKPSITLSNGNIPNLNENL